MITIKMKHHPLVCVLGMLTVLSTTSALAEKDNLRFRGALVAEPCVIAPGDEEVQLAFGVIVDKYLYQNVRTVGMPFELRLAQCDLSLAKSISVTFTTSEESHELPGLLVPVGNARGIAIGLETASGQTIKLDKASELYPLTQGSNVIHLKAYVQVEPLALANRSVVLGAFTAVSTFRLTYE
ncbi:fimbrial protein [Serratia liquefaciens]|uniref:fimbrial protein n=1 Tax=Serratia liquefaciens TaxID=614 RepID=UPI002362E2CE|nr:fimbrial protein [Serratia liquefaciens]